MNRKDRRAAAKQERTGRGKTASAAKIEEAISRAQVGDLAGAEALLEPLYKADPDQPEVSHQLGMIYARTGRTEAGLELLRRAVEARPEESLYWNNLAAACLAIERSQEAVDAVRKALALDPKNFMAWQNLALGRRDLGDRAGAVEAFDRASALGSLDAGSLASWGECLGVLGRFPDAEAVVRRGLDMAADDPAILSLLGWLLSEQGKSEEARETFRRSLELKPDQFLAAFNYAVLSLRADDNEVGLRWLRRATSIDPKSVTAWRFLAIELARQNLKDEALPVAERTLRLAPGDTEIQNLVRKLKGGGEEIDASFTIDFGEATPAATVVPKAPEPKALQGSGLFDLSVVKIGNDD
ncbi:tetratricopeptide repeat protein [Dongia sedimenti]|uniref:Tetratricopeptide repeat protein n=1 Tax=Dongia sedimenti TaxID=3064282 RepID=A0ABU0YKG6_9PROT|nr:tetratricopeptide repeat protein [Rhodospirillaceae bacterium R-7]